MEDNLVVIENNCGLKPLDQELVEISNDPNFVFPDNKRPIITPIVEKIIADKIIKQK